PHSVLSALSALFFNSLVDLSSPTPLLMVPISDVSRVPDAANSSSLFITITLFAPTITASKERNANKASNDNNASKASKERAASTESKDSTASTESKDSAASTESKDSAASTES
ncbi:hypothetical protein CPA43_00035, partial [Staphylococcus warneri]|uniref:hypothetical protein n=1 Tax=Staphylococcus warneri TaxID=1292 RepID=UPI000FF413D2